MDERWIVLGFYQDRDDTDVAFKDLRLPHFRRSATIHHGADGVINVSRFGIAESHIARFRSWVVLSETLLVIEVRPRDLDRILDQLRHGPGSPPIVFAFHPKHVYDSSSIEAIRRVNPAPGGSLRIAAGQLAARLHLGNKRSVRRQGLLRRLIASENDLKQVHQALAERARTEQPTSMSAVWLLDNAHNLQEHIDDFRRNLPRR